LRLMIVQAKLKFVPAASLRRFAVPG
jgi:hypothetical protein